MTLRTFRRLIVVGGIVLIVQLGVLERVSIGSAHPDAFLLFAIAAGLVGGAQQGAVVGFATGLVADLFVITPYGMSSLCYVLVAFGAGLLASMPPGRAPLTFRIGATVLASIAGVLLFAGLLVLVGQPHLPRTQLVDAVVIVSIVNALGAVPAASALQWAFATATASGRELAATGGSALR